MNMTERLIRLPEVIPRTGLSRSTIYNYIEDGTFPKQIKIGKRAMAFVDSEIEEWVQTRITESRN